MESNAYSYCNTDTKCIELECGPMPNLMAAQPNTGQPNILQTFVDLRWATSVQ